MLNKPAKVYLFFFTILIACSSSPPRQSSNVETVNSVVTPSEQFRKDSLLATVVCKSAPSQSFALYLPPVYNDSAKLPLIIFFDPHGSGSLPLMKYKSLAKQFGYILIGSNDSKNGLSQDVLNQITSTLLNEAKSRLSVNERRIVLAGFSGGAKVAILTASNNPAIRNLIYCGAVTQLSPEVHLSLLGFAGTSDMNYTDLLAFDQSLQKSVPHFMIEWNGKHEWPDSIVFTDAFYWLTFNACRNHEAEKSESLIDHFISANKKKLISTNDAMESTMILSKIVFFLEGLADVNAFSGRLAAIEESDAYKKEINQKQALLRQELSLKQDYMGAFQEESLDWWKKEIQRIEQVSDPKIKPMYQRLLGFISLACYSVSANAIQQNQYELATKMLAIYKLADPKNADRPFFEACLFAKQNQNEKAINALHEAVELGLTDRSKILNEPALQSLQSSAGFQEIINSLK